MIANPSRLTHTPTQQVVAPVSHDEPLIKLLQGKYKGIYLNPCFLKTILETIDRMVHENMVDTVVSEIVDAAIQGSISGVGDHDEYEITLELE